MGVTRVPLILVEFFHPSYNWTFRAHLGSLAILVCQKSYIKKHPESPNGH